VGDNLEGTENFALKKQEEAEIVGDPEWAIDYELK